MAYSENGMGKEQDKLQKEDEEFAKPMGGKEQTGGNPVGSLATVTRGPLRQHRRFGGGRRGEGGAGGVGG